MNKKETTQLNNMVSAAMDKDASRFKAAFDSTAMSKIQTAIDNKTQDISKDSIKSANSQIEDA